jgi:hypothetical protein
MRKLIIPLLLVLAFLLGALTHSIIPKEVVCDNVEFIEGKLAPYSSTAECNDGILVTLLD